MARRKWTDEEIALYRQTHAPVLYFNPEDSNIFVPKAYGLGKTFNWGNPVSWVVFIIFIGVVVAVRIFLKK